MGRNTRMQQWINYRIRVTLQDGRMLVGTFMAFDRHMNIVMADCEEYRRVKQKGNQEGKEIKRTLGFVMLRGENIISMTAEAPPPSEPKKLGEGLQPGPGRGQMAGRGVPVAPLGAAMPGLSGPVRGIGGPAPSAMAPQRPGVPFMSGPMMAAPGRPGVMGAMPPGMVGMPPPGVIPGMPPMGVPPQGMGGMAPLMGGRGGPRPSM